MHRDGLLGIASTLTAEADRYGLRDEDREWIGELTIDAQETCFTPATMVILGMATAELRTAPPVLELDSRRPHSVHRALQTADRLRCLFAGCGSRASNDARRMPVR